MWVWGFSECHAHNLGPNIGEASLAHGSPPAQETSLGAVEEVRSESARLIPVSESCPRFIWTTAKCHDKYCEDHCDDSQDFDAAHEKFGLTEFSDMQKLER